MSDSEQYNENCGHCNCLLTENVHIYCLSRGSEEQTWCSDCVQTFWQDLKSEGWTADDETWSELGFDDGEDKPEADPHYADCSSRNSDKCNCGAESEVDDIDAPNIYPYKKCSVCSERSSCGNYNDDKQWICESCNPESEDEKPAPKVSVNFRNAMRMEDEYNAMEKAKEQ